MPQWLQPHGSPPSPPSPDNLASPQCGMWGPQTPPTPAFCTPFCNVTLPLLPSRGTIKFPIPFIWPGLVTCFDQRHFGGSDNMWRLKPTASKFIPLKRRLETTGGQSSLEEDKTKWGENQEAPADGGTDCQSDERCLGTCQLSPPQMQFKERAQGKSAKNRPC